MSPSRGGRIEKADFSKCLPLCPPRQRRGIQGEELLEFAIKEQHALNAIQLFDCNTPNKKCHFSVAFKKLSFH
jgi:hypothetical protein